MNDVIEAKVLSWYSNIKEYFDTGKCDPRTLMIQPNNTCNNNCDGCYYLKSRINNVKYMDLETIKTLVHNSINHLNVYGISLSGGGEPSLHPEFKKLIKFLITTNKSLSLISNGTWKDRSISKLLSKNFTFIRIGLDCYNSSQYKLIKKTNYFNLVLRNIKDLVKYSFKSTIGIKFLLRKQNCTTSDVYNMIDLGLGIGVDYVQFKLLKNDVTQPTKKQLECLSESLCKIDDGRVVINLEEKEFFDTCFLNMLRVNVDTDGSVYLCSRYHHRINDHYMGNINEDPIHIIWDRDKHWKAIKNIDSEKCNVYNCMLRKASDKVCDLIHNDPYHLDFAA